MQHFGRPKKYYNKLKNIINNINLKIKSKLKNINNNTVKKINNIINNTVKKIKQNSKNIINNTVKKIKSKSFKKQIRKFNAKYAIHLYREPI
jgi:vacuolar-type H+-ATPase subunit E/Vma4